jgi:hypothetical protein
MPPPAVGTPVGLEIPVQDTKRGMKPEDLDCWAIDQHGFAL